MDIQALKQRFGITGNDPALDRALEIAVRVASTDLSVLISGESGVGKEFFPQVIHAYSPRKHQKYIAVNCGAIPEGTIDSELFGHEKGAFTGATEARKGYFEEAGGGTIFLDEVAELPHSTQVRLLRVLQTGEFIRVGSSRIQKTDVRVIAATNIDLQDAIRTGRFREDLYYRLNTVPIVVPPLRDRRGDIVLLFRKFAADIAQQYRMPVITLDDDARQALEEYSWPGNIRQLKNVAEQISAVEQTRNITAAILRRYLPAPVQAGAPVWMGGAGGAAHGDERELLYKVLFDLRGDMFEVKRMLARLVPAEGAGAEHGDFPPRYLLEAPRHPEGDQYAESEEVRGEGPDASAGSSGAAGSSGPAEEMTKERAQRESILRALRRHGGKRKEAARELFMSERTLYRKIKELEIDE